MASQQLAPQAMHLTDLWLCVRHPAGVASACLVWHHDTAACRLAHASAGGCIALLAVALILMPARVLQLVELVVKEPPAWMPEARHALTLPARMAPWVLGIFTLAGTAIAGWMPTSLFTGLVSATLPDNAATEVERAESLLAGELTARALSCMWLQAMRSGAACLANNKHTLLSTAGSLLAAVLEGDQLNGLLSWFAKAFFSE
jgi:hypothetical protein